MPLSRSFRNAAVLVALLLPATALAADSGHSDKVSFYFAAHEDDWQLFMNPSAFGDVIGAAGKTVFVHITAGDDGLGIGSGGRKQPYYLAREEWGVECHPVHGGRRQDADRQFSRPNDL